LGASEGLAEAPDDTGPLAPLRRVAKGLLNAASTALGARAPALTDAWGRDPELVRNLAPIAQFLYQQYWRVAVSGAEHLPAGPCVIVANHAGALPLDGPVLHAAIRRERPELPAARWLLEDPVFYAPFLGVLLQRLGGVRANPENALRLLSEGRPVIVFPEGMQGLTRPSGERYTLKRFGRGGYVKLALNAGVPIIPAAVVGAGETSPQLANVPAGLLGMPWVPLTTPPLPARWSIAFGAPVTLSADGSADDLAWIQGVNDRVRDTIAALLTTLLRERTSVFR
jgi:1-acyl-sn-glycerol-3-phosphate acyltransferase